MAKIALYPGTFDPITNGHLDLIERAAKIFDQVIVAVAQSKGKSPMFDVEMRRRLVEQVVTPLDNVSVCSFSGLLVDLATEKQANIILRGLRSTTDFDYELQLTNMNRRLAAKVETLFLTPAEEYACISSSLIREIFALGGDIAQFVPKAVIRALVENEKRILD
jgi:pantetheine-phosphate adenylyltransferase